MQGVRPVAAALIGVLALGAFALWHHRLHPPLTGDEPGYLVVAESLWYDHDTNLANNFGHDARIDSALLDPVGPAATVRRESPTNWRPTQPLGMGMLLSPAVAIGHRGAAELQWARRLMILLAALLIWQIFELLADQVSVGVAVAVTGGVALAFPLVGYSNQVYPEIPAALLLTAGLRGTLTGKRAHPVLVGIAAAGLPWLSMRYLPLALGLVAAVLARPSESAGARRLRPPLIAGAVLTASVVTMLIVDSNVLRLPTGPQTAINTYRIGVGGLFSPVYGLLPYAPQLAVGVIGLGLVARLHRGAGAVVVIGALAYEFGSIPFGFRGYALPARFQIVLIPLLALGIAQLLRAYPRVLVLFAGATVIGLIIVAQAGSQPTYGALYTDPARPVLPLLKPVASILPGFALAPGHTGVVIPGSRVGSEPPVALRRGTYELVVKADPQSTTRARVVVESDESGAMRPVAEVERALSRKGTLAFPFDVHRSGVAYQFRVAASDGPVVGQVESLTARLTSHGESRTAPSERDVPLGVAWILATLALVAAATRAKSALDSRCRHRVCSAGPDAIGLSPREGCLMIFTEADGDLAAIGGPVAVVGYGNQGRSWALNLRDSGLDPLVCVRHDSSREQAEADGFAAAELDAASGADVICVLVPDDIIPSLPLRPRADVCTIVVSGYTLAFDRFTPDGDLGMVAPRMLGPEVRRCYVEGAGFITAVGVHRDVTGTAQQRVLAIAKAIGGLREGAIELTPRQEAILDLGVEQVLSPVLTAVNGAFVATMLAHGIPLEAVIVELVLSGEVERTYRLLREVGYAAQSEFHSPTSQYGQLSRRGRYDHLDFRATMEELTGDIESGRFADEWDAERDQGYPTLTALKEQHAGPMVQAFEEDIRRKLGPGARR